MSWALVLFAARLLAAIVLTGLSAAFAMLLCMALLQADGYLSEDFMTTPAPEKIARGLIVLWIVCPSLLALQAFAWMHLR